MKETSYINPYLGFQLSSARPSKKKVKFITQKTMSKLGPWKAKFLSKAGRLCLISSALNSIPNYIMQCMMLPETTLQNLNSDIAKFLWGKGEGERGMDLVG